VLPGLVIALLDGGHASHQEAFSWLERKIGKGRASCPLTENCVVRIMSQPAYPACKPAASMAEWLAGACASPDHQFWPADVSLLAEGVIDWPHVLGHRQVADAYLLALAVRNAGRLVAFDRRISLDAVAGASPENLVTIP
jgi:uncharacterized protein